MVKVFRKIIGMAISEGGFDIDDEKIVIDRFSGSVIGAVERIKYTIYRNGLVKEYYYYYNDFEDKTYEDNVEWRIDNVEEIIKKISNANNLEDIDNIIDEIEKTKPSDKK